MNMMPSPAMAGSPITEEMIEQAKLTAEACSWEEISGVLRSNERRNYNIDIETTATAFEDDMEEKQQRTEFMGAMTQWLQVAMPAIQSNPTQAPLFKELTMFFMGGFKVGRSLEETFEDAFDQIKNMPPQPNPEAQKAEMEAKAKEAEFIGKQKDREADMAFKQQDHALKVQGQQADLAFKGKELEFKERELGMKAQESEVNRQMAMETAQFDRQARQEEMAFKREDALANRAAQDEDRQFQRQVAVEDLQGKRQDRELKTYETQARLTMDQDEQQARRALEGEKMQGEGGKTAKKQIEDSVAAKIGELATQFATSMQTLQENQVLIVTALQDIKGNQDETGEALDAIMGRMTATRKLLKDPKTGKASGVQYERGEAGDRRAMIEKLLQGESQLIRDKQGRVEAF